MCVCVCVCKPHVLHSALAFQGVRTRADARYRCRPRRTLFGGQQHQIAPLHSKRFRNNLDTGDHNAFAACSFGWTCDLIFFWVIYHSHTLCIRDFHVRCFSHTLLGNVQDPYASSLYILSLPAPSTPFLFPQAFHICVFLSVLSKKKCCLLVLNSVSSPPRWIRQPQLRAIYFCIPMRFLRWRAVVF